MASLVLHQVQAEGDDIARLAHESLLTPMRTPEHVRLRLTDVPLMIEVRLRGSLDMVDHLRIVTFNGRLNGILRVILGERSAHRLPERVQLASFEILRHRGHFGIIQAAIQRAWQLFAVAE